MNRVQSGQKVYVSQSQNQNQSQTKDPIARLYENLDKHIEGFREQVRLDKEIAVSETKITEAYKAIEKSQENIKILNQRNEHLTTHIESLDTKKAEIAKERESNQKQIERLKAIQAKRKQEAALKQQQQTTDSSK